MVGADSFLDGHDQLTDMRGRGVRSGRDEVRVLAADLGTADLQSLAPGFIDQPARRYTFIAHDRVPEGAPGGLVRQRLRRFLVGEDLLDLLPEFHRIHRFQLKDGRDDQFVWKVAFPVAELELASVVDEESPRAVQAADGLDAVADGSVHASGIHPDRAADGPGNPGHL